MISSPTSSIVTVNGLQHSNPSYSVWLQLDQLLRLWMFITISSDLLTEVHDVPHSFQLRERFAHYFNTPNLACAIELKCTLSTLSKDHNQSMDDHLRGIKQIVDYLALIGSPLSDMDLVTLILNGVCWSGLISLGPTATYVA